MGNLTVGVPGEKPEHHFIRAAHKMANLDGCASGKNSEHHVIRVAHKRQTLMLAHLERTKSIVLYNISSSQMANLDGGVAYLKITPSIMLCPERI
jgi:hypothetical protein